MKIIIFYDKNNNASPTNIQRRSFEKSCVMIVLQTILLCGNAQRDTIHEQKYDFLPISMNTRFVSLNILCRVVKLRSAYVLNDFHFYINVHNTQSK